MGRGVWTVELQCIKIKLKEKKWWNRHLGQQFALCGVSSQPITRHLYSMWPSCDFILLWPINTQHGGRGELGKHRSSQITAKLWLGQLKPLVYKRGKKQEIHSGTCDIFVHLRNLCWDFHYVCTENVLQWKKELHLWRLTQEWDRPRKKICFIFSLFISVLIVIVHACLYREGDIFVFLFEIEPEKTVAVDKMDLCFRPSTSEIIKLTSFATGIEWPLCTAWLCWLVGPDPILSVALCTSSYLTT